MKATELRIGNYLIENDKVIKLTNVSGENAKDWSKVQPIPLTEEWLLKFGFDKICHGRFSHKTSLFTLKLGLKRLGYPYILCHYKNYPKPCKHVHQLQNLYFALTGEELKYTP